MMRADEAGQDHLAGAVNNFGGGIARLHLGGITDGDYVLSVRDDRAVPLHVIVRAQGGDNAVLESNCHVASFLVITDKASVRPGN